MKPGEFPADRVRFGDDGLVPVVAQDALSGDVLMLAYADRAALDKTLETGRMHYHSRSRGRLWMKGEESGHIQELVGLSLDCDGDAILARVKQRGPACHTNNPTCFTHDEEVPGALLSMLAQTIAAREHGDPSESYTARLLKDKNLRAKKVGEESTEFVMALGGESRQRVAEEAADVLYHVLVACWGRKVSLADVLGVLEARRR